MPLASRNRSLALLLIIVVSYAAFDAHATTHMAADPGGCELCTGHGDPSHAIPLSPGTLDAPVPGYLETTFEDTTSSVSRLVLFRQRAPPRSS